MDLRCINSHTDGRDFMVCRISEQHNDPCLFQVIQMLKGFFINRVHFLVHPQIKSSFSVFLKDISLQAKDFVLGIRSSLVWFPQWTGHSYDS